MYCHIVFLERFIDYRHVVFIRSVRLSILLKMLIKAPYRDRVNKALRSALYSYANLKIVRSGALAQ